MKFNKWTLGLAAVGAVSMASAVRADEAKLSQVQTALSNTTISGYVDVSANYVAGSQRERRDFQGDDGQFFQDKRDQFSLDTVTISLDKPMDDSPWSAGYHVDLNAGSKAINALAIQDTYGSYSGAHQLNPGTFAIRQAYITLRAPVGNGIDLKIGAMDGITGYEGNTAYANPNYSRSYGYAINPASYTGLLATYKICDAVSFTGGIVNRGISLFAYGQYNYNLSSFDYVASASLTAPDSWGFLKGSVVNLQTVQGFDNNSVNNYSINGTLNTPLAGLKLGFAYDLVESLNQGSSGAIYGVYASYQATDKLGFNVRGEYLDNNLGLIGGRSANGEEVTATVSYNLWANVLTRAEIRWDHIEHNTVFDTNAGDSANQFVFALNAVYKF